MDQVLNSFFVYGTLRPGETRWHALEPYVIGNPMPATLSNVEMYNVGGSYPCILKAEGGEVTGEVVMVKPEDTQRVLRLLDNIEGYIENSPQRSLFLREIVQPSLNIVIEGVDASAEVEAWAYFGGSSFSPMEDHLTRIDSGNWKQR